MPAGASAASDAVRAGDDGGSEVERLRAEVASLKDRALREQAELENFKKRAMRDKTEALRWANEGLLRALLPVIDNLQRAVDHARASREVDALVEGVELVLRSFLDALERHGVKPVDAHGNQFDPSRHEAIGHIESTEPANTVVAEHQRGYTFHDRLLRPAMVTVGKGPAPPDGDASREPTRH
jgi:molecular chaperone GrpE